MTNPCFKAAFLGIGNMGSALISGAIASGVLNREDIIAFDIENSKLKNLRKKIHIQTANSLALAIGRAEFVFLCVKPQQMKELLLQIRNQLHSKHCLCSIAAGISTRAIESYFDSSVPVIRIMPNTPALVRSGIAVITKGRFAKAFHLSFAKRFFSAVGKAVILPEKLFDAVTAVSGSGPAYLFYLTEILQKAAEKLGIEKSVAQLLARTTVSGAGKMLNGFNSPQELRRAVTSPGGTTETAIRYLQKKAWDKIFIEATQKAKDRSRELGILQGNI